VISLNIKITERDRKLFNFLFKFRYAKKEQIIDYLNCSIHAFYQRTKLLQKSGYLESKHIHDNKFCPKIYFNSVKIRKTHEIKSYQKKPKVWLYTLEHHLKTIDIFNILVKAGVDENKIYSEREIIINKIGLSKYAKSKNNFLPPVIPDLAMKVQCKNGRFDYIAIEVELSRKSNKSMRKVFRDYNRYAKYYAVEYLCPKTSLKNNINKISQSLGYNYIKAYTLDTFYSDTILTFGLTPSLTYY
jgi:hypothetical protein